MVKRYWNSVAPNVESSFLRRIFLVERYGYSKRFILHSKFSTVSFNFSFEHLGVMSTTHEAESFPPAPKRALSGKDESGIRCWPRKSNHLCNFRTVYPLSYWIWAQNIVQNWNLVCNVEKSEQWNFIRNKLDVACTAYPIYGNDKVHSIFSVLPLIMFPIIPWMKYLMAILLILLVVIRLDK